MIRSIVETLIEKVTNGSPINIDSIITNPRNRDERGRRIVTINVWSGKINAHSIDQIEQLLPQNTSYRKLVIAMIKRFIAFNTLNPENFSYDAVLVIDNRHKKEPIPYEPVILEIMKLYVDDETLHISSHHNIPKKVIQNFRKRKKVVNIESPKLTATEGNTTFVWSGTISFSNPDSINQFVSNNIEFRKQVVSLIRMLIYQYNRNQTTSVEMLYITQKGKKMIFKIYRRAENKVWIYMESRVDG